MDTECSEDYFFEVDMGRTILIVDDSTSFRQVVSISLKCAGYDVIESADGVDALTKLSTKKVHLIVSDFNMPKMDGVRFIAEVKSNPSYQFIPIIVLTTESSEAKKLAAQAAGAKSWMTKPLRPEHLVSAVSKLISP